MLVDGVVGLSPPGITGPSFADFMQPGINLII